MNNASNAPCTACGRTGPHYCTGSSASHPGWVGGEVTAQSDPDADWLAAYRKRAELVGHIESRPERRIANVRKSGAAARVFALLLLALGGLAVAVWLTAPVWSD